jgi:hypothetical protein
VAKAVKQLQRLYAANTGQALSPPPDISEAAFCKVLLEFFDVTDAVMTDIVNQMKAAGQVRRLSIERACIVSATLLSCALYACQQQRCDSNSSSTANATFMPARCCGGYHSSRKLKSNLGRSAATATAN